MKAIYRLEEVHYHHFDMLDEEDVEERLLIGYFSSIEKMNTAINICIENGINPKNIRISTFFDNFTENQKYVYVLSHVYSIIQQDGNYLDYDYIFPPYSNRKKCLKLKSMLIQKERYAFSNNRCYDIQPPDGFYISNDEIDFIYHSICKKI